MIVWEGFNSLLELLTGLTSQPKVFARGIRIAVGKALFMTNKEIK